jgi:hypothetical protein
VEPVECLHVGVQAARTNPVVSGDGEAGRILGAAMNLARFHLGRTVATPGALSALEEAADSPGIFIKRHVTGDWGELDDQDRQENEFSVEHGFWLLSSYTLSNGGRIWIITEADRGSTALLLPSEY